MIIAVVYTLLRRYVLNICFKVFEYTEYWLSRERFHIFWEHASRDLLCRWLVDSVFIYLYREIGFFHQFDRAYVSPFSKLRFFLMDYERRDNSKETYLRIRIVMLVDSIKHVLGTCQKEVLIIIGSHVTFGALRERGMSGGVRYNVWDWLQAFPSLAYPSPSAPYFLHSRPVPFPSRKVLETAATQATLTDCHAILLREEGTRVEL